MIGRLILAVLLLAAVGLAILCASRMQRRHRVMSKRRARRLGGRS